MERRPQGLLAQVLGVIVGIGVIVDSVVVGAFLLAALLGFALIAGTALMLRLWWLRRRMERRGAEEDVIETEYTVIDARDRDSRRR